MIVDQLGGSDHFRFADQPIEITRETGHVPASTQLAVYSLVMIARSKNYESFCFGLVVEILLIPLTAILASLAGFRFSLSSYTPLGSSSCKDFAGFCSASRPNDDSSFSSPDLGAFGREVIWTHAR
jgi:hypothetical protein